MTEQELEDFGRAWVRALGQKARCYELAAQIAGTTDSDALANVRSVQRQAEGMTPLTVAVVTLSGWGARIPPELAAKAECVPVLPQNCINIQ